MTCSNAVNVTLLLLLVTSWSTVRTQWAQTIGWGGAGVGKRGYPVSVPIVVHLLRHRGSPRDAISASSISQQYWSTDEELECAFDPMCDKRRY